MRYLAILILAVLLAGCAAPALEAAPTQGFSTSAETLPPTVPETTAPLLTPEEQQARTLTFLMNAMTPRERVGQLFLVRCPTGQAEQVLAQYPLGGYILFDQDFQGQTPESLGAALERCQLAARLPLLIAVDEEGGTVCRVSSHRAFRSTPFPSPRTSYQRGGLEEVLAIEQEKARLLTGLGIHVNLGPVCDIDQVPGSFMYQRSLGQEPEITGSFAAATAACYRENGLGCVLKHFPGHGANSDTHLGFARDDRVLEDLESWDLIPFQAGIDAGCDAVMVGHTICTALDDTLPASLSPAVHQYLRQEMGFAGVIVTDDLQMQAITDCYGPGEAAVLAVLAGNDLICCTDYAAGFDAVWEAVQSGRISQAQLDAAVLRVLTWKDDLGILFA